MKNYFRKMSLVLIMVFALSSIGDAQKRSVKSVKKIADTQTKSTVVSDKRDTLEMVFVLDTTGSMGGLLEGAKQKIWSIVNDVMQRRELIPPPVRVLDPLGSSTAHDRGVTL